MHIGHNTIQCNYYNMSNQQLPTTDQQRHLGIIITTDLKWQKQIEKSCKMANRVLSSVNCPQFQAQKYKTDPPIMQIPRPPTSQTCCAILVPTFKRDIDKIEKIQRRATNMNPEIRNHSYHQRIQDLDLISHVQRRLRGKLIIEVFKYMNRFTTTSARGLFDYDLNNRTRNKSN